MLDGLSEWLLLFGVGLFEGDFGWFFDQIVMRGSAGNVVKLNAELFAVPSLFVDVSENMHFRPYSLHKLQQAFTATFFFLIYLVQYSLGRPMGDQNIDLIFVLFYHCFSFLLGIAKLPIEEFRPLADAKYCQPIDLYFLEVQKVANTLKLESFLLCFLC